VQEKPRYPSRSFKLGKTIQETLPEPPPPPDPAPLADAPFDLAAVIAILSRFTIETEGNALHAALTTYPPVLDGHAITIFIDNELLLAKVNELLPSFLARFKRELGNDHVTLQFTTRDEQQETAPAVKHLYTAADKFDHFLASFPAVRELRDCLELEIP
jgi:hypothetical protein